MPRVRPWLKAVRAELAQLPATETIVLTHSLGGLLWLHWAAAKPMVQVARALLVAPSQPDEDEPESLGFRPTPLDRVGVAAAAHETLLVRPWAEERALP